MFFPGFHYEEMTLAGTRYRLRTGGVAGWKGETLLLLHGQPQTHAMWHRVGPLLADRFAVVCADLPAHLTVAELSHDLLAMMSRLGHRRFSVAGHDFGAHVAVHLAMDAPERVSRLGVIEAIPLADHAGRADMAFELSGYPSCWFGQLHPKPEALNVSAPDDWFRLTAADGAPDIFDPEAVADYLLEGPWNEAVRGHGAAAAAETPAERSSEDRGRRIACPMQVLWTTRGRIGGWYDPRRSWQELAEAPVSGFAIESGHFVAEESPFELGEALAEFMRAEDGSGPA